MGETRGELLKRLEAEARTLRHGVWRTLRAGGGGHAGGSLSAADILAALYFHRLRVRPSEPEWPERDRFVLSKGHANAALAAVLAQAGFIDDALPYHSAGAVTRSLASLPGWLPLIRLSCVLPGQDWKGNPRRKADAHDTPNAL